MIHFRSNIQTAEFGLYQMYKHSASPRVYKSDINLLRGLYILHPMVYSETRAMIQGGTMQCKLTAMSYQFDSSEYSPVRL